MSKSSNKKILIVHQNYPAQFQHLAPKLVSLGHEVIGLCASTNKDIGQTTHVNGGNVISWSPKHSTTITAHPWVHDIETKFIRGEATAIRCEILKKDGWIPDLIIGHPGWGEMLFLDQIWPGVPQFHFLEFYYKSRSLDTDFDPEFTNSSWETAAKVKAKAASPLLSLESMTKGMAPTQFQASTYPTWVQSKIDIIHDGIDTQKAAPNPKANIGVNINSGTKLIRTGDPVITFVNRTLEPYRGYHQFIRALPQIQKECQDVITIIIGDEGASYGAQAPEGMSWKNIFLQEVIHELDLSRIIFTGSVPYDTYITLLQISACHIYLTYPFVLGWSCLEAMSCEAHVIGSATAPVQEVICDGVNGTLVDFFNHKQLAEKVIHTIKNPDMYKTIRMNARKTIIEKYDLHNICLPKQIQSVESLL